MNRATAAGTNVSDSSMAAVSAMTTVNAMGWNIFPSTPVRAKIGRYTAVMISTPNRLGFITSADALAATSKRSSRVRTRPSRCCVSPKRRRQFSTMITAPSTIRPKSSAPRLIRLAEIRFCTMPVMVISMVSGMTAAVIRAARRLPSSANSTAITSSAPSIRFVRTVAMVRSTSAVRS